MDWFAESRGERAKTGWNIHKVYVYIIIIKHLIIKYIIVNYYPKISYFS